MKLLLTSIFVFITTTFSSLNVVAAAEHGVIEGHVKKIRVRESGNIEVYFSGQHSNPMECMDAYGFVIKNENPSKEIFLSMLLSAQLSGYKISGWATSCLEAYGTSMSVPIVLSITQDN